jgi:hypothetical protein
MIPPPTAGYVEQLERINRQGTRKRWRDADGRYLEWDSQHGEFEVYNKRGWHIGTRDCDGNFKAEAKKGRYIDV